MRKFLLLAVLGLIIPAGAHAGVLDQVKARGHLRCGVSQGQPGFSNPDAAGNWSGIDVEVCRGIAAAIFDDPSAVRYTALSAKERFTALTSGEVDVLSRNTTWTIQRDTALGLDFTGITFYDGQGFLTRKELGLTSATQLDGASICTQTGTTNELNAADFFRSRGLDYTMVVYEKEDEYIAAYDANRCDAITADRSGLYGDRLKLADPDAHVILPETISKEPLGPVVRQGDPQWADVVRWTLFAMVNAEELGVTSQNVEEMLASDSPEIMRLVGKEGAFGESMGLTNDWAYRIVRHVGNYGEIYDRTVGKDSPLRIDRGLNALWKDGGLQYAPPIR